MFVNEILQSQLTVACNVERVMSAMSRTARSFTMVPLWEGACLADSGEMKWMIDAQGHGLGFIDNQPGQKNRWGVYRFAVKLSESVVDHSNEMMNQL